MSAPIVRTAAHAAAASFLPWLVGALMAYALLYQGGSPAEGETAADARSDGRDIFSADWLSLPWALFPLVTAVAVALLLAVRPTPSRWLLATRNTVVYAVVLLLTALARASAQGAEAPVDDAFLALALALFTLQLPLCFLLSAALTGPLEAPDGPPASPPRDLERGPSRHRG
ncbi:hypothetical protein I5Q34_22940 [Streptomyces sp. AV19]|uniref:hypothetical protein n=1 Tax=Streptomyces sp. AV19 TaxID=2793068 RepID=UPI0018FE7D89|nr:hypothetical protein [Streptomyces sp. AV19]MBH1937089.1 hypothetical protein [Streptomyces sp. AV19]MDG4533115.1 hypothetical protein [Streptomyces sp. AV19]